MSLNQVRLGNFWLGLVRSGYVKLLQCISGVRLEQVR